jgi:hypothetical protein
MSKLPDHATIGEVIHVTPSTAGFFELDQTAARDQLKKWRIEADKLAEAHLRASSRYGHRLQKGTVIAAFLVLTGVAMHSAVIGHIVGADAFFITLKDTAAMGIALAGVYMGTKIDGFEYPKRAVKHTNAHVDHINLRYSIEALELRKALHSRDIDQLLLEKQKITERSPPLPIEEEPDLLTTRGRSFPWRRR